MVDDIDGEADPELEEESRGIQGGKLDKIYKIIAIAAFLKYVLTPSPVGNEGSGDGKGDPHITKIFTPIAPPTIGLIKDQPADKLF
jgi:hypothetical protein